MDKPPQKICSDSEIEDSVDKAVGEAWAALMTTLTAEGVMFEDSDTGVWVDTPETARRIEIRVFTEPKRKDVSS